MFNTLITAEQLLLIITNEHVRLLDCRFRLEDTSAGRKRYSEGHIPGALYVHLDEDLSGTVIPGETGRHPLPEVRETVALWSRLGIDEEIQVVVYDDMGGGIAARAWWMLRWMGHEAVAVLDGGISAWEKVGGDLQTDIPMVSPRAFKPDIQESWLLNAREVEVIRTHPEWVLVDSRTTERYRGKEEPIDPVAGHIPGAINAPHPGTVDENGRFQSPEALADHFKSKGVHDDGEHTAFYCGSGVTACRNILAYEVAGWGRARLYGGSWSDWIATGDRPVASDD